VDGALRKRERRPPFSRRSDTLDALALGGRRCALVLGAAASAMLAERE
jgi:hypothetical protein